MQKKKKKGGGILKYEPRGKFIFRQLVPNFEIFGKLTAYSYKTIVHLKKISAVRKVQNLKTSPESLQFSEK